MSFLSSALGKPYEYRSWFSDAWQINAIAKPLVSLGDNKGGNLMCRPSGSFDPYSDIFHTQEQALQVAMDHDLYDLRKQGI